MHATYVYRCIRGSVYSKYFLTDCIGERCPIQRDWTEDSQTCRYVPPTGSGYSPPACLILRADALTLKADTAMFNSVLAFAASLIQQYGI